MVSSKQYGREYYPEDPYYTETKPGSSDFMMEVKGIFIRLAGQIDFIARQVRIKSNGRCWPSFYF